MVKDRENQEEYLIKFCRDYYATTNLPTSLRRKNVVVYSSQGESMNLEPNTEPGAYLYFEQTHGPEFCAGTDNIQYGRIPVAGTEYDVYLGPVFPSGITEELIRGLMREQIIPLDRKADLEEYLMHIPDMTTFQLGRHMVMVNRILNDEVLEVENLYGIDEIDRTEHIPNSFRMEEEDSLIAEGYKLEQQLYGVVRSGNENMLQRFLFTYAAQIKMGQLAASQMRHYKNTAIRDAVKLVYQAAIPAGVSPRQAIELSNRYIRGVEALTSEGAIASLEYSMLKDFCRMCAAASVPDYVSGEIAACMAFIRNHVNESISIADVADSIHRSPSHVMKLFHDELQMTAGHFITRCKLEEARCLLLYTDMSLTEISHYLCFSSQSYFQNVFKKKYKMTPGAFRKEHKSL